MSRPPAPSRGARGPAVLGRLVGLALTLTLASCTGTDDAAAPEPAAATPLSSLDTSTLAVTRGPWCDQVPESAVERALGSASATSSGYVDGERARITAEVRDVAHEYSCTFRGEDGASARAWVFAPPVTREQAGRLVRAAGATRGCRQVPDAPAFGQPSVATLCRDEPGTVASFRGLFGDAWLTCSLQVPDPVPAATELVARAGEWCAAVAQAATPR